MRTANKNIVTSFIEEVWNGNHFEKMDSFLSVDYVDHSLPAGLPANKEGTKRWIIQTGRSFEHTTIIDDLVCEGNKVIVKIRMVLKHTGTWRHIEPTGLEISTSGYRHYRLASGKICEHWALIDGDSIENQLKTARHGCHAIQ
jgi:predicted SnoaL-like aldol condensation-catalyzing enzyme